MFFDFRAIGVSASFVNKFKYKNNIVGGIRERTWFKAEKLLDKRGGTIICAFYFPEACSEVTVTDNIVAGAWYGGFMAPGHDCGASKT